MEKIYQLIANILPRKIVYFAYIRLMAFATTHDEGVNLTPDSMPFSLAAEIWERKR